MSFFSRVLLPAALVWVLVTGLVPAPTATVAVAARPARPNVVLVYADDMRADDLRYMPYTRSVFGDGTTFTRAISPHPLCCPARAELMTGQYAQNNGVHHNRGEWGGHDALVTAGQEQLTPQWFADAGYRTAYVGKYLNGYRGGDIPGVRVTDALSRRHYSPTGFRSWNAGNPRRHAEHQTTWTGARTSKLVRRWAGGGPFFVTAAFLAPHAMKHSGRWVNPVPPDGYDALRRRHRAAPSLDDPAFNEPDVSDKPAAIRDNALLGKSYVQATHEARALSLYAIDDQVRRIVRALKRSGTWDDTVLLFTSDNGFQLGEHRVVDKDLPYQQSLAVPLLMRGPGVPTGADDRIVTTVDVPVTLAALAGIRPGRLVDGVDARYAPRDRAVLIQSGDDDTRWDWRGVATPRWTYAEHTTGEVELYDRAGDPHELENLADDPSALDARARLARLYAELRDCAGEACVASAS